MKIGINWASPPNFIKVQHLLEQGDAHFCELMLDNFIHLEPKKVKNILPNVPIAFHFVATRFLEREQKSLEYLAEKIKPWLDCFNPLYVSDHIIQFSKDDIYFPNPIEFDYDKDCDFIIAKVIEWQSLLDSKIYFENNASLTASGKKQVQFYHALLQKTGAGLLFDFSNAVIAEINNVSFAKEWQPMLKTTKHFHVSGFKIDAETNLAIDSHAERIEQKIINQIKDMISADDEATLVVEFVAEVTNHLWPSEINRFKS